MQLNLLVPVQSSLHEDPRPVFGLRWYLVFCSEGAGYLWEEDPWIILQLWTNQSLVS